jgi:dipeptidyl aminopeptidase/acylaminoacyl peptidase
MRDRKASTNALRARRNGCVRALVIGVSRRDGRWPSYNGHPMEREAPSATAVEAQLERVLGSTTFRGAERSRTLLRFLVTETLQGRGDELKEYTLGAEALGRGSAFDPRTDPVARVEASRLRSRLDVYYATEGAGDPVRMALPRGRYAPAFELRHEVSASGGPQAAAPPEDAPSTGALRRSSSVQSLLAALALVLVTAVTVWLLLGARDRQAPPPESESWEITTPATTDPVSLALSPDGRTVAFVASAGGPARLWLRPTSASRAHALAGTDHAAFPFWSPDGRGLGFFAEGRLKWFELETGLVRTIAVVPVPAGASWNRDDVILYPLVPDSPLVRRSLDGSSFAAATELGEGHTGHRGPAFLPDDRRFLFFAEGSPATRGVYVGELGTTASRRLLDADAPAVFAAPDHLLYVQNRTLFARRLDLSTMEPAGGPVRIADGIAIDPLAGLPALAASGNGRIVYRTGTPGGRRQFLWFDRDGNEIGRVGAPATRGPSYGSLSPDGRRLAVQRTVDGNTDIHRMDLERDGAEVRFTTDPQPDIAPIWSPDGTRIAYASSVDGVFQLFVRAVDELAPRPLLTTPQQKQITDWSRDDRYILYRTVDTSLEGDMDIWALPLDGSGVPVPLVRTPYEERDAQFSPDSRYIAYQSNETGRHEVYVRPFPGPGEPMRISEHGGTQVRWRDGELFYLTLDGELMAVAMTVDADGRVKPGDSVRLFQARVGAVAGISLPSYSPALDGERFLIDTLVEEDPAPITIIVSWRLPDRR